MRRIVNFRASLFASIGLVTGIYSFYEFIFGDFWFGLIVIALVAILGITAFILKTKAWRIAVFILAFILCGFGVSQLTYNVIASNEAFGESVIITGRVTDIGRNGNEGSNLFYLENCSTENGQKLRGRVSVYIFGEELSIGTGNVVTVCGNLYSNYPVQNDIDSRSLRNNIRYELRNAELLNSQNGKLKLGEFVRKYVYDCAQKYMPDNGDIMYSLLVGDRNPLSEDTVNYFTNAGILHLLAVSGLHIGFVVAVVCFVLRRFKLHPLVELTILIIPLILYAYICNFTPSAVRALLMVVCAYFARSVYGRYDILTSLSLAVVCILVVKPFFLFDIGFQLSALSIYGIASIYTPINRRLNSRKVNKILKYFVNSLAISASCSLATLFALAAGFNCVPTFGVLLNVIAIPLISVTFVLGIFGLLPWFFHYIFWIADKVLQLIVVIAKFVANLPFSTVVFGTTALSVVIVAVWLFIIGGYVNFRKTGKAIAHSICVVALALCVGITFVKTKTNNEIYVTYGYDDVMCVTTSVNGEAVIIGDFSEKYSSYKIIEYVGSRKITDCYLYFTSYDKVDTEVIEDILTVVSVAKTYKLDFSFNGTADEYFSEKGIAVIQQVKNTTSGDDVKVSSVYDAELRGVIIAVNDITVSLVYGNESQTDSYPSLIDYSDVYVLFYASSKYSEQGFTTLSAYQSVLSYNYGANKYGNFTIRQKDGKITILFRN